MKDELREVNILKLQEIQKVIDLLPQALYTEPQALFEGSTVGQHFRHIIEFYGCLLSGVESGSLCYDDRERDLRLESDQEFAKETCANLIPLVRSVEFSTTLELRACCDPSASEQLHFSTSVERELAYTLDHAIHHLAMIKIILRQEGIKIDPSIGVAPSTIRHKETCAQ